MSKKLAVVLISGGMDSAVCAAIAKSAGYEIAGHTLGVVGLGKIGCLVADAAIKLGMHVVGYDPEITVDAKGRLTAVVNRTITPGGIGASALGHTHVPADITGFYAYGITGTKSLTGGGTLAANRTMELVNDSATPGNTQYYGTNGSGMD
jgi:hypothetical protein